MLILGIQGSPRKKGNTQYLLSTFLSEARNRYGARTVLLDVDEKDIRPCKEYIVCEKKGFCPIDDDMKHEVYPLLRRAEIIVAASPVFFYNVTAQLKALIDRSQTLWARKYRLRLKDPQSRQRRGFMLAVGATRGKSLFDGMHLTMKYFFDAVDATYDGSLIYRNIESAGEISRHPGVEKDIASAVETLCEPLHGRKKILFVGRGDNCRSQMAGAFAQRMAGDKIEVMTAGAAPTSGIDKQMIRAMADKGIDMAFRIPVHVQNAITDFIPDEVITICAGLDLPNIPHAARRHWEMPETTDRSPKAMDELRDEIERRVAAYVDMI